MLSRNGFSVKDFNDYTYTNSSEKIIALADINENNHNNNNNDKSRQSTLLRHNDDISKIFNDLCKKYNVVLVLTGKQNPWTEKAIALNAHHLVTRHLMAIESTSKKFKISDPKGKSLIYSASYPTLSVDKGPYTQLQDLKDSNV